MLDRLITLPRGRPHGAPRRMTGEERRAQLIKAAETMFLQKGYHATTMDDIAREAGMSKKTLYQVCATKLALFDAFLSERFSAFSVPIESDGRAPPEVLVIALCRLVRLAIDVRQIALTRLLIAETPQSEDIAIAIGRQCIGPGRNALKEWLEAQAAQGTMMVGDPEQTAATLFFAAAGDFLFGLLLRTDKPPTEAEIRAQVEHTVRLCFGCVQTAPDASSAQRPAV